MREVLSLHVGQCGVQMGSSLWEQYCREHDIGLDGNLLDDALSTKGFSSFFMENESSTSRTRNCSPIAMFVDLEPSVADQVRVGKTKGLYRPDQIFSWTEDAAGLFPRGYYLSEKRLLLPVQERVRRFLECFDSFQGLMITRSIGGGTGSGYTSLVLETLSEDLVKKSVLDMAVYPSKGMGAIEPYNTLLSTHSTSERVELSFMMDNEAMFRVAMDADTRNDFQTINNLVAQAISSITAGIRFAGSLNVDLGEFHNNLVPFPRIKFPFVSHAPILSRGDKARETVQAMTKACFESGNRMFSVSAESGEYVAVCLVYSGDVAQKEVVEAVSNVKEQGLAKFVSWSPGLKIGINHERPIFHPVGLRYNGVSVGAIANSTSTFDYWRDLNRRFDLMYKKAAFLHWFFIEGSEKEEFRQARENSEAIETDYRNLGDSSPCGDA